MSPLHHHHHSPCLQVMVARSKGLGPGPIAQHLTKLAFEASMDRIRATPYSLAATQVCVCRCLCWFVCVCVRWGVCVCVRV